MSATFSAPRFGNLPTGGEYVAVEVLDLLHALRGPVAAKVVGKYQVALGSKLLRRGMRFF